MTPLEIAQKFCKRTGIPAPDAIFGETVIDDQAIQIGELLNEGIEALTQLRSWTELQYSETFTSVSGEDQGAIDTLAPNFSLKLQNNTLWDRTTRLKVFGPLSPQEWQQLKALEVAGPLYRYRIEGGHLWFFPSMEAGHTMAFEYVSAGAVLDSNGTTLKDQFTDDDDEFRLHYTLLLNYLRWAWKREKGLPYAEDQRAWQKTVLSFASGDGTKPIINMAEQNNTITPGIWVPAGSWDV